MAPLGVHAVRASFIQRVRTMLVRRVNSRCISMVGGVSPRTTLTVRFAGSTAGKEIAEEDSGFKKLGVSSATIGLLKKRYGIVIPTEVQKQSLPLTLRRKSCIIQSPTGSGKSLSFLIPALEDASPGLSTVILAPTRELATQLHQWAVVLAGTRKRSKQVLLCASGMAGDMEVADPLDSEEEEEEKEEKGKIKNDGTHKSSVSKEFEDVPRSQSESRLPDILLIATPKKLLEMLNSGTVSVKNLRRVVLDECDKLIAPLNPKRATWKERASREKHPRPAAQVLTAIKKKLQRRELQLICTSATADLGVREELLRIGWSADVPIIQCSSSRTTPSTIQHQYLLVKEDTGSIQDKVKLLVDHFLQVGGGQPALVFIHRGAKIDQFVWSLRKQGLRVVALYEKTRDSDEYKDFLARFKSGQIQLAVGTEETVRGLDFPWVHTVYLMEVPRTAQEYLHLCGRVGRVGRAGQAVVLVVGNELPRLVRHYTKLNVKGTEKDLRTLVPSNQEQNGCHRPSEEQSHFSA